MPPRSDAPMLGPEQGGAAEDETPRGVWLLLGAIAAAKLSTLGVVLWLSWSPEAGVLAAATVWHWLPVAAVLLSGPILFRWRLRRVRARREALRRAEWMVAAASDSVGTVVEARVFPQ
jgi:hypothetical protein